MTDIGCAGILVADTFYGPLTALPQEGQLIAVDTVVTRAGGCAANVAICLSKQGVQADVVGCLGRDLSARLVIESLEGVGIGTEHITYSETESTSQTAVLLVQGQDRRYVHLFGANKALSIAQIDRWWLGQLKVFYLGGLFVLPGIQAEAFCDLLQFCRGKGVTTVIDVVIPQHVQDFHLLKQALPYIDYFLPNEDEARQITGQVKVADQLQALQAMGAGTVIVTRGPKGVMASRDRTTWQAGTFPVNSVDSSGSGDAFAAGVLLGIINGWPMERLLTHASAFGASATRAIGTTDGVFTAAELDSFLSVHPLDITRQERLQ